jgi:DNA mismatch endonuclease (patch repair protein)
MADIFTKEKRSDIMSRIRSKNTEIELVVFKFLRAHDVRFQKHYRGARGTPDVAVPGKRVAVFVDGDFWHGYRYPTWRHKMKKKFWREKIERNRARDRRTFAALRRQGWRVLRVWEHEIVADPFSALARIRRFIEDAPNGLPASKRRAKMLR